MYTGASSLEHGVRRHAVISLHNADEFHAVYPGAKVIGVPALVAKKAGKLKFDGGKNR